MWQKSVRYLDHNAGAGVHPHVRQKLIEIFQDEDFLWANPSSSHRLGQKIQQQIYSAAAKVAGSLCDSLSDLSPDQLLFTSSGTEANQMVLRSAFQDHDIVVIGSAEHSSSYDLLKLFLEKKNPHKIIESLPLLSNGQYDLEALRAILQNAKKTSARSVFVSLFWANHETGVIQDLAALSQLVSEFKFFLHLDAAQAWGKIPINLLSSPAHYVTFSSHKIGAPSGTGIVWIRPGNSLHSLLLGTQSRGLRGGTENALGIIATGFAAELLHASQYYDQFCDKTQKLRDLLENQLRAAFGAGIRIWGSDILGSGSTRVPNTSRFSIRGFSTNQNWVELLDLNGYAVSHGSACKSHLPEPSRVLLNMGATKDEALNSIRVSFSSANTAEDVDGLVKVLYKLYVGKLAPRNEVVL